MSVGAGRITRGHPAMPLIPRRIRRERPHSQRRRRHSPERALLADDRAVRIGALQTLDYSRAVVITHDKWKEAGGGIPQYAFLLATAREIGSGGGDDDEVLLLRVEGTASLSLE
jgi:hypothetical protein